MIALIRVCTHVFSSSPCVWFMLGLSESRFFLAGSIGGIAGVVAGQPFDTIKVHTLSSPLPFPLASVVYYNTVCAVCTVCVCPGSVADTMFGEGEGSWVHCVVDSAAHVLGGRDSRLLSRYTPTLPHSHTQHCYSPQPCPTHNRHVITHPRRLAPKVNSVWRVRRCEESLARRCSLCSPLPRHTGWLYWWCCQQRHPDACRSAQGVTPSLLLLLLLLGKGCVG